MTEATVPARVPVDPAAIRAAALRLFAEQGYRATTMADIGAAVGVRGPSLYRYVESKQDLLAELMLTTMRQLLAGQAEALASGGDVVTQVRRMVEAHVRFHAGHRDLAFVGNREIDHLESPAHEEVLALRREYQRVLRGVIERGRAEGRFDADPRLSAYAILDMGIGLAAWFRADGPASVQQTAWTYADLAIRMLTSGNESST